MERVQEFWSHILSAAGLVGFSPSSMSVGSSVAIPTRRVSEEGRLCFANTRNESRAPHAGRRPIRQATRRFGSGDRFEAFWMLPACLANGGPCFLADASGYEINKLTRPRLPDSIEPDANAWRLISAIEFPDTLR